MQNKYFLISFPEVACWFCQKFKKHSWQTFGWGQWPKFCQYGLVDVNDRHQSQSCLHLVQKDLPTYCHQGIQECSNFGEKKSDLYTHWVSRFSYYPTFKWQKNSWDFKFGGSREVRRDLQLDGEGCVSSAFPPPAPASPQPGSTCAGTAGVYKTQHVTFSSGSQDSAH